MLGDSLGVLLAQRAELLVDGAVELLARDAVGDARFGEPGALGREARAATLLPVPVSAAARGTSPVTGRTSTVATVVAPVGASTGTRASVVTCAELAAVVTTRSFATPASTAVVRATLPTRAGAASALVALWTTRTTWSTTAGVPAPRPAAAAGAPAT
ncbi:hypothetical protein Q9R29_15925 [Rothia sp. ARF10]|nr:hypothetical protein [Rothia sp. ARF10]